METDPDHDEKKLSSFGIAMSLVGFGMLAIPVVLFRNSHIFITMIDPNDPVPQTAMVIFGLIWLVVSLPIFVTGLFILWKGLKAIWATT